MFNELKSRINKAFGEYEYRMIQLFSSLNKEAVYLDWLSVECAEVSKECQRVADGINSYIKDSLRERETTAKP